MSVSLYRKYRSKSLDEIVGQKGIVTALNAAISKNSISHAYLFTGPRGVGKTSIARILAFEIIGSPYDPDNLPVDIIEIDAASNRGIEEIRDLRDKVRIAPVSSKYKVYIIDEVHMLTTPAFNALLKTLEEPPAHVVFILATTESHKLPETIVSRTQRYNFSLATTNEVKAHLKNIAKKEDIKIDDTALDLIATHSGGSMRDALSILDHVRHLSNDINAEHVRINIGLPSEEIIQNITSSIAAGDAVSLLEQINIAEQDNVAAVSLAHNLLHYLKRNIQTKDNQLSLMQTTSLMKSLSRVEGSNKPEVQLTIALLDSIEVDSPAKVKSQPIAKKAPAPAPAKKAETPELITKKSEPSVKQIAKVENEPKSNVTTNDASSQSFTEDIWRNVLEDIRSTHNTIYSVLRVAEVNFEQIANRKLLINFQFPFHQKRMKDSKNSSVIRDKLSNHGYDFEIEFGSISSANKDVVKDNVTPEDSTPKFDNDLSHIRGVFGGAEVME